MIRLPLTALLICAACAADPGYGGRTSKEWISVLRDTADASTNRRVDAAFALGRVLDINPGYDEVIDALVGALSDPVDQVRMAAGAALARDDVRAEKAMPSLVLILADSAHPEVRREAAFLMGIIGAQAPDAAIKALRAALHDPDAEVRATAAQALGMVGVAEPAMISDLAVHAADSSVHARVKVLEALRSLEADTLVLLPLLQQALHDPSPSVRRVAAFLAGSMATQGGSLRDELIEILGRDSSPEVRRTAAYALGSAPANVPDAIPALEKALADPDSMTRIHARDALSHVRGERHQTHPQ